MIELMIWTIVIVGLTASYVWPRVTWNGEDWKHLRLRDDFDPAKSRGRIRERRGGGE